MPARSSTTTPGAFRAATRWARSSAMACSPTCSRFSGSIAVVLGAALLVVAVGLSRLYLGLHYFSDVVGGYAAGVLWLSACISGIEVARRRGATPPPAGRSKGL